MRYVSSDIGHVIKASPSTMALSDAILLGSTKHPQAIDGYYRTVDGKLSETCALVAAVDCVGLMDEVIEKHATIDMGDVFPILATRMDKCPSCHSDHIVVNGWYTKFTELVEVIMHLNDDHRWSRPRIAEWVKTIEQAEILKTQQPTVQLEQVMV